MTEQQQPDHDVTAILKIIDELNTLKDVDTILDRILSESRRLSGADAGSIFLIPEDELVGVETKDTSSGGTGGTGDGRYGPGPPKGGPSGR